VQNVNVSRLEGGQAETAVAINPTNPDNIVVTSNVETFRGLFEAYSTDGGATWATQIIADGGELGTACCDSSLAFDAYGNVFLTYLLLLGDRLPVALSIDGGASFHIMDYVVPKVVAPGATLPGLGRAGFDPALFVTKTNVGDYDAIPAASSVTVDAETGLAWDRTNSSHDGRVYLLWTQERPDESDDMDVVVQFSDDDGLTWSAPVRVNDDTGVNSQFMPKIALDQTTGVVAVSWYDCRNDSGSGLPGDTNGVPNDDATIYAAVSTDGGIGFGPNLRVGAAVSNGADAQWGSDFGDYPALASESGSFYRVWADNSNSTRGNPDGRLHAMDVYTARVRVP